MPANVAHNAFFLSLVETELGEEKPTPAAVGAAVRRVLMTDLTQVVPWWGDYLDKAKKPNSPENVNLAGIVDRSVGYANRYYEALAGV